jgi:anti-sigma regulatory factor (Ser/Thr protein kinase)
VSAGNPTLTLRPAPGSAALDAARQAVLAFLAPLAPSALAVYAIELVLEEVLTNQFKYAAAGGAAADIVLHVSTQPGQAVLCFDDDGAPFDPLHAAAPRPPRTLEEAPIGGLGLVLVRHFASSAGYERIDGRNRLSIGIALA